MGGRRLCWAAGGVRLTSGCQLSQHSVTAGCYSCNRESQSAMQSCAWAMAHPSAGIEKLLIYMDA